MQSLLYEAKGANSPRFDLLKTVIHFIANIMDNCFDHQIEPEFDVKWFKGRNTLGYARAVRNRVTGKVTTTELAINDTYPMPELVFESVVLHELVHILMVQTGYVYEEHGRNFDNACKIIERKYPQYAGMIAGAEIGFIQEYEVMATEKTKPYYIMLVKDSRYRGGLYSVGFANTGGDIEAELIKDLKMRTSSYGTTVTRKIWLFLTDNKVFKTMLPPIARKLYNVSSLAPVKKEQIPYYEAIEDQFVLGLYAENGKIIGELDFEDIEW